MAQAHFGLGSLDKALSKLYKASDCDRNIQTNLVWLQLTVDILMEQERGEVLLFREKRLEAQTCLWLFTHRHKSL